MEITITVSIGGVDTIYKYASFVKRQHLATKYIYLSQDETINLDLSDSTGIKHQSSTDGISFGSKTNVNTQISTLDLDMGYHILYFKTNQNTPKSASY